MIVNPAALLLIAFTTAIGVLVGLVFGLVLAGALVGFIVGSAVVLFAELTKGVW